MIPSPSKSATAVARAVTTTLILAVAACSSAEKRVDTTSAATTTSARPAAMPSDTMAGKAGMQGMTATTGDPATIYDAATTEDGDGTDNNGGVGIDTVRLLAGPSDATGSEGRVQGVPSAGRQLRFGPVAPALVDQSVGSVFIPAVEDGSDGNTRTTDRVADSVGRAGLVGA